MSQTPDTRGQLPAGERDKRKNHVTLLVPVGKIVDLLQTTHRPDCIEEYRDAIARGDKFPPISVIRLLGRYFIADGHKRFSAYRELSASHVQVEVWTTAQWLNDQLRQFRHKTSQTGAIIWRSLYHPAARKQARRLFWDTVGHWKRIFVSLKSLLLRQRAT